jgi:hypothetical protein
MMKQQEQMISMGMHPGMAALGLNHGQNMMMGQPGMGQATNPMDMLQMQQLQQMQSMFNQMGLHPPQ